MTDRPILFSDLMVRALLREIEVPGTGKTNTRRLAWRRAKVSKAQAEKQGRRILYGAHEIIQKPTVWQKVVPGDRLYVREAVTRSGGLVQYVADHRTSLHPWGADWKQDPRRAMHMHRWASRITLTVTETRLERVQDISEVDAEAEGTDHCDVCNNVGWINSGPDGGYQCTAPNCGDGYIEQFQRLWNSLHKPGNQWEDNPEVVALTYTVALGNIDVMGAAA